MQFPFLSMLRLLRSSEEILLYGYMLPISAEEREEAGRFLEEEYRSESEGYPFSAPPFDRNAAIWAAQTVYAASQLVLCREQAFEEQDALLLPYTKEVTPSSILSADLSLRFLPDLITQLKLIDPEDVLCDPLQSILHTFHYSGVRYQMKTDALDFAPVTADPCLLQLYTDRVIEHKRKDLALHPSLGSSIRASLGLHAPYFWKEYHQEVTILHDTHS